MKAISKSLLKQKLVGVQLKEIKGGSGDIGFWDWFDDVQTI